MSLSFYFALGGFLNGILILSFVFFFTLIKKKIPLVSGFSSVAAGCFIFCSLSPIFSHFYDVYYTTLEGWDLARYFISVFLFEVTFLLVYSLSYKKNGMMAQGRGVPAAASCQFNSSLVNTKIEEKNFLTYCGATLFLSVIFYFFLPNAAGIRIIFGSSVPILATMSFCLALLLWKSRRSNWVALLLAGVALLWGVYATTTFTGSRQPLLGLMIAIGLIFANSFTNRNLLRVALRLLPVLLLALYVLGAYEKTRRSSPEFYEEVGPLFKIEALVGQMMQPEWDYFTVPYRDNSAAASLAAIELVDSTRPDYLHSLKYYISTPIPRQFYENKPEGFGLTLPRDFGVWETTGFVNWGPGIPGHAANDGSFLFSIFYAIPLALLCQMLDFRMIYRRDILAILALSAMSPYLIGFARGDIVVFSVQITLVLAIYLGAKVLFGKVFKVRGFVAA